MKKLAILVLNYNGQHFLKKCFDSLRGQSSQDFEIYLVDNNSGDGSREYTEKNYPNVFIVNTGSNLGFTGAYNYICNYFDARAIHHDYYLFLNNDTECDALMVEKIIEVFEKRGKVGIVMPTVVNETMIVDAMGGKFLFFTGTTLGIHNGETFQRGDTLYKCFWASGCALAIRSSLFKDLGYFNDYFIYYEDLDISWRVNNAGYHVVATDATYVKHLQGGAKTPSSFQMYLCEKNRILSYWQNLPNSIFLFCTPFLLCVRLLLTLRDIRYLSVMQGKFKGIVTGLYLIPKFKKRTVSLKDHITVIKNMNKVLVFKHYLEAGE